MSDPSEHDLPTWGVDYDLERWSYGTTDRHDNLIWHHYLPPDERWKDIRIVTLNLNPHGEPFYVSYKIPPDRPLDAWGTGGKPGRYDLDDLAAQAFHSYGFEM